jgi:hypothetical protein
MVFDTKKREPRKSMHQPGWITLDGGFAARPCVVRDLSSSGARLTIEDSNSGEIAAGVFARRADGAAVRGGLAARQNRRHQIRAIASAAAAR